MIALNLPPFDHKIKNKEGKLFIFDILRKKYVFLTPEGVKTSESDKKITSKFVNKHLQIGIDSLQELAHSGESVKHLRFE